MCFKSFFLSIFNSFVFRECVLEHYPTSFTYLCSGVGFTFLVILTGTFPFIGASITWLSVKKGVAK